MCGYEQKSLLPVSKLSAKCCQKFEELQNHGLQTRVKELGYVDGSKTSVWSTSSSPVIQEVHTTSDHVTRNRPPSRMYTQLPSLIMAHTHAKARTRVHTQLCHHDADRRARLRDARR